MLKSFMGRKLTGYQYLDKFFDLQFNLRQLNIENYINSLNIIKVYSGDFFDICSKEICIQLNFSLRQINRYFNLISLIYDYIKYNSIVPDATLSKSILFPILLGIKMYDINIYNRIIRGEGEKELKEIVMNNPIIIDVFNEYFGLEQNKKELLFDFSELYRKIFVEHQESDWVDVKIGNISIKYGKERKILLSLLSFLNEFVKI